MHLVGIYMTSITRMHEHKKVVEIHIFLFLRFNFLEWL